MFNFLKRENPNKSNMGIGGILEIKKISTETTKKKWYQRSK